MPPYRRSRALWDEARRPDAPYMAVIRAILYELQPIRFSTAVDLAGYRARSIANLSKFATQTMPWFSLTIIKFVQSMSRRNWMVVGGILLYYVAVRIIHALLDAGPIVMILTALGAILTVGLGDNDDQTNENYVSAYSVFNRGFTRLMGSVDVENLVNQHVGGGMAMAAAAAAQHQYPDNDDDDNNNHAPPRARAAAAAAPVVYYQQDDDDYDDEEDDDNDDINNNNNINDDTQNNQARKSGKKARRRDLQQRRELQRQRRAAMEQGFGNNNGQDNVAMQRLIEEQIAAENNNR